MRAIHLVQRSFRYTLALAMLSLPLASGCRSSGGSDDASASPQYIDGALAYQQGDKDAAIASLRQALQENPNLIMAHFLLGNIYREKSDYNTAADEYKRVVQLDPYSYQNHYNLALMYHLLDRLKDAAVSYRNALQLNPDDPASNMNFGLVCAALGRPADGERYSRRATELDPKSAEAFANLGVILDSQHKYADAEKAYRRSIELDSNREETLINLAANLAAQQQYKQSASMYEKVLARTDGTILRERFAQVLLRDGRLDDAVREFTAALKLNGNNYQAMNGLGDALLAQYRQGNNLDEAKLLDAVKYWKKSLSLKTDQPRIATLVKNYDAGALFAP